MTAAAKLEVLALASCLGMLVLLLALLLWSGLAELTDAIERRRSERESMSAASDYWPHQEQAGTSPETLAPATPGDGSSIRTIPNPYNIRVEPVPDLTAWRYPATDAFQGPLGDDEWLRKRANSGMHQPEFEDAGSDHELV